MSKFVVVLSVAFVVVGLDQLSKWFIDRHMELYQSIPVIDSFFHISYVRNRGGAFSFLANLDTALRLPFFIVVSLCAIAALLYFVRQVGSRQYLLLCALGGILGGALGNLTDRMARGGMVVDFLDVHYRGWHWPTFNVADSFISVGVVVLMAHSLFSQQSPEGGRR
ncbi:MAG TPA: signal peptidase II [Candidatus Kryptonia bacterium]|nr:signal peptidase II [Candidatus Kryptonia bacterium]